MQKIPWVLIKLELRIILKLFLNYSKISSILILNILIHLYSYKIKSVAMYHNYHSFSLSAYRKFLAYNINLIPVSANDPARLLS